MFEVRCNGNIFDEYSKKLDKHKSRFEKSQEKYSQIEPILTDAFQKIAEERTLLAEVKVEIQSLMSDSVGSRNSDFIKENSYLKVQ